MPECTDDSECTFDSVCVRGPDGYRTCICAGACPPCKIFLWQKVLFENGFENMKNSFGLLKVIWGF